ncbi:MAG: FTR1 family iron permease [Pseudomonadota bacterium]
MEATALIVFREVLEAALIVTIVLAATRGVATRARWVGAGILAGVAGSVLVALLADAIAGAAAGAGQEIFNAGVLLLAVAMLSWHVVWMGRHGRALAGQMRELGAGVTAGERPLTALSAVVALAVLREGSEVVLFLYGLAAAGAAGAPAMAAGGLAGLGAGVAVGLVLYFGLVRIPLRHFFTVTNWLIVLLAAGLAAQAARYLAQAGLLPALGGALWDSSWLLDEQGWLGQILHTLIGYMERPSGLQAITYGAVVVILAGLMRLVERPARTTESSASKPLAAE